MNCRAEATSFGQCARCKSPAGYTADIFLDSCTRCGAQEFHDCVCFMTQSHDLDCPAVRVVERMSKKGMRRTSVVFVADIAACDCVERMRRALGHRSEVTVG